MSIILMTATNVIFYILHYIFVYFALYWKHSDPKLKYSKIIALENIIHFYIELHNSSCVVQKTPPQATTAIMF